MIDGISGAAAVSSSVGSAHTADGLESFDLSKLLGKNDGTTAGDLVASGGIGSVLASVPLFATQDEERTFTAELTRRLNAAGVDTSKPINLTVDSTGKVLAADGTPDKDKIDAVFAADPSLRDEYGKIANTVEANAVASKVSQYMTATGSDPDGSIWNKYAAEIAQITGQASKLSLDDGELDFDGVNVLT
jgi:hypothetical protein